jgi:hypothetical protein
MPPRNARKVCGKTAEVHTQHGVFLAPTLMWNYCLKRELTASRLAPTLGDGGRAVYCKT